jgi:hypothetical protein
MKIIDYDQGAVGFVFYANQRLTHPTLWSRARACVRFLYATQSCSRARARRNDPTSGRCSSNRNRSGSLPHPLPAQVAPFQLSTRYHRTPHVAPTNSSIAARHTRHMPLHALACLARFAFTNLSLFFRRGALQLSSLRHRTPPWTTSSSRRSEYARVPLSLPCLSRLFRFLSFFSFVGVVSFVLC